MGVERRTVDRGTVDRRQSRRWQIRKWVPWRVSRGRRVRCSELIERSLHGLVLRVDRRDLPAIGTRFFPDAAETSDRFGFRSAIVRRISDHGKTRELIFAEIES